MLTLLHTAEVHVARFAADGLEGAPYSSVCSRLSSFSRRCSTCLRPTAAAGLAGGGGRLLPPHSYGTVDL